LKCIANQGNHYRRAIQVVSLLTLEPENHAFLGIADAHPISLKEVYLKKSIFIGRRKDMQTLPAAS